MESTSPGSLWDALLLPWRRHRLQTARIASLKTHPNRCGVVVSIEGEQAVLMAPYFQRIELKYERTVYQIWELNTCTEGIEPWVEKMLETLAPVLQRREQLLTVEEALREKCTKAEQLLQLLAATEQMQSSLPACQERIQQLKKQLEALAGTLLLIDEYVRDVALSKRVDSVASELDLQLPQSEHLAQIRERLRSSFKELELLQTGRRLLPLATEFAQLGEQADASRSIPGSTNKDNTLQESTP